MTIYRTYMKTIPKEFREISGSFCNKPIGGLWGCRGEEWKEWCESEDCFTENLKTCFKWKLKSKSKVYRIKTKKDFMKLLQKYALKISDLMITIDYNKVAEDYDAVEVMGGIIQELKMCPSNNLSELIGLSAWDVPSIVVLNLSKVIRL